MRAPLAPVQIFTFGDQEVAAVTTMKLVGVATLTSSLKWDTHIKKLIATSNSKKYLLVVLCRAGVTHEHPLKFCVSFIRQGLKYCVLGWHCGISQRVIGEPGAVQLISLRVICPDLSYRQALEVFKVPTLASRREELCRKFACTQYDSDTFRSWFPPLQKHFIFGRNLRNKAHITIPICNFDFETVPFTISRTR